MVFLAPLVPAGLRYLTLVLEQAVYQGVYHMIMTGSWAKQSRDQEAILEMQQATGPSQDSSSSWGPGKP